MENKDKDATKKDKEVVKKIDKKEERIQMPGEDYTLITHGGQFSGVVCDLCSFKADKVAGVKNHITRIHKKNKKVKAKPEKPAKKRVREEEKEGDSRRKKCKEGEAWDDEDDLTLNQNTVLLETMAKFDETIGKEKDNVEVDTEPVIEPLEVVANDDTAPSSLEEAIKKIATIKEEVEVWKVKCESLKEELVRKGEDMEKMNVKFESLEQEMVVKNVELTRSHKVIINMSSVLTSGKTVKNEDHKINELTKELTDEKEMRAKGEGELIRTRRMIGNLQELLEYERSRRLLNDKDVEKKKNDKGIEKRKEGKDDEKKRLDCNFWMRRGCRESWKCEYTHNPSKKGVMKKERRRSEREEERKEGGGRSDVRRKGSR